VKTQEEHMHTARGSSRRSDEATDLGIEHPMLDQEAIGRLAYFFWEERGCPNDSPDEDWFRAEAGLRNRLAAPHPTEGSSEWDRGAACGEGADLTCGCRRKWPANRWW
jgi:hypothetical protein